MRRVSVLIIIFLLVPNLWAKDPLAFFHDLGRKKIATFGDAIYFTTLTVDKKARNRPSDFKKNLKTLKKHLSFKDLDYDRNEPLNNGMLSLIIARYLKLSDSLFFLIFDNERYAHRACIGASILTPESSNRDKVTGQDLIEVMTLVIEKLEKRIENK